MIICDDFLEKAQRIYSDFSSKGYVNSCPEMDYRECARTSYYYIYHVANQRASQIPGNINNSVGQHQRVIDKLRCSSDISDQELGDLLALMKIARVKADYTLNCNFSKNDAYKVLRRAERLKETIIKSTLKDSTA
ncbi:hypothetical protein EGM70_04780 [Enterobacteriaceae bacterium 89]|nr:hypothetical protein [Enterobacteriaceae bacterium 89]